MTGLVKLYGLFEREKKLYGLILSLYGNRQNSRSQIQGSFVSVENEGKTDLV